MSTTSFVFFDIEIEVTIPPSIGLRYVNPKLVDAKVKSPPQEIKT